MSCFPLIAINNIKIKWIKLNTTINIRVKYIVFGASGCFTIKAGISQDKSFSSHKNLRSI